MNETHWKNFYSQDKVTKEPSQFAEYVHPYINGHMIELGCGNGRDTQFFKRTLPFEVIGIDKANDIDVEEYIKEGECKFDFVYTRFFWHSITRQLQLAILRWTTGTIFIEARTTQDAELPKEFPPHDRNYVYVPQLVEDLKQNGFQIIQMTEGTGLSPYLQEDPFLIRVIAKKVK